MFDGIQQCPRCQGLISREHFVQTEDARTLTTLLYCEHCELGRETLWEKTRFGGLRLEFSLDIDSLTPLALDKFRETLLAEVVA